MEHNMKKITIQDFELMVFSGFAEDEKFQDDVLKFNDSTAFTVYQKNTELLKKQCEFVAAQINDTDRSMCEKLRIQLARYESMLEYYRYIVNGDTSFLD